MHHYRPRRADLVKQAAEAGAAVECGSRVLSGDVAEGCQQVAEPCSDDSLPARYRFRKWLRGSQALPSPTTEDNERTSAPRVVFVIRLLLSTGISGGSAPGDLSLSKRP